MEQHKQGVVTRLAAVAMVLTMLAASCGLAADETAGDAANLKGSERPVQDLATPSTTTPVATTQIPVPPLDTPATTPVAPAPVDVPEFPDTLEGRVEEMRYLDLLYTRIFPEPNPSRLCEGLGTFREAGYQLELVSAAQPDAASLRQAFLDVFESFDELLPVLPEEDHPAVSAAVIEIRPAIDHIRRLDTVDELRSFTAPIIQQHRPLMEGLTTRLLPSCPHLPV